MVTAWSFGATCLGGRAQAPSRLCNRKHKSALERRRTTLRRVRAKERETQALQFLSFHAISSEANIVESFPCYQLLSKPRVTWGLKYFITTTAR